MSDEMGTTVILLTESESQLAGTEQVKRSPGPWQLQPFSDSIGYDCMTGGWAIKDAEHKPVVYVDQADYGQKRCDFSFHSPRAEANARLIAAAPELLRVLLRIRNSYSGYIPDFIEAADAAIAKAIGHTP